MYSTILSLFISMCMVFSSQSSSFNAVSNFLSQNKVSSYTATGALSIELESEISDNLKNDMKPFNLQSLFNALNDLEISWKADALTKNESTKTYSYFEVTAPDFSVNFDAYSKISKHAAEQYVLLPTASKIMLPEKYEDKKYLSNNVAVSLDEALYFEKIGNMLTAMFDENSEVVKFIKENKEVFSKKNSEYTLKLNSGQLLDFSKAVALEICSNEETADFLNYYISYFKDVLSVSPQNKEMLSVIGEIPELKKEDIYGARTYITEFFENINGYKILGEDGITFTVRTNSKNQITNINGVIDLELDLSEQFAYTDEDVFKINALIRFDNSYTNINKLTSIKIPASITQNCVDLVDWIEEYTKEQEIIYEDDYYVNEDPDYIDNLILPATDGTITLIDNYNYKVNLKNPLKVIDGVDYIAIRDLEEMYYFDYIEYNPETNTVHFSLYNEQYAFKIGSNEIKSDFYSITLTTPTLNIDGTCYVPLKSFLKGVMGENCYWDGNLRAIIIHW